MSAVAVYLGTLLLSLVVAMLAALQLADFFNATEEFILVIVVIVIFATAAIAVFAITSAVARTARAIDGIAIALALFALTLVLLPTLIEWGADRSRNPFAIGKESIAVTLELLVPAMLIVLVQWGLVRRRWHRLQGTDDLSAWPWVTTAVAGLAVLNPYGLAALASTVGRSAGDQLWQFTATVTVASTAGLLVMAGIECYIRENLIRRRLVSATLPPARQNGEVSG